MLQQCICLSSITLWAGPLQTIDANYVNQFLSKHTKTIAEINDYLATQEEEEEEEKLDTFCCQTLNEITTKVGECFNFGQFASQVIASSYCEYNGFGQFAEKACFHAIVVHPDCDGALDRCPIYFFDIETGSLGNAESNHPLGLFGNIRKWFEDRLHGYLESVAGRSDIRGPAEDEIVERARAMYADLQSFSLDYIHPPKQWAETAFQDAVVLM
jgi:hypothetical protein